MSQPVLAGVPTDPVPVPEMITALAGDCSITPVWRNAAGGLTFRIEEGAEIRYAKWVAAGTAGIDLSEEAERLA
jgi:kanamycin kinase